MRAALLAAATALLIAAIFAAALLFATLATRHHCRGVDADALSDAEVASHVRKGWRGDPADGKDHLYPPGCVTP